MVLMQPHSTHIIYHCAKFGDDRTSLTSKVCPMPKYSDIYDLWEPVAIVIFNESLHTFVYILPVGQCTPYTNVM